MNELKKLLASGPSYVGLYLLFMLPTYILPYFGSNSLTANAIYAAAGAASGVGFAGNLLFLVHILCLGALCLLAWLRGSEIGKTWIVTLPIVASVFDIVPGLSMIPLVPTVMHVIAIVTGVSGQPQVNHDRTFD